MELNIDNRMKSGAQLAFVGDAVFELLVREHIAQKFNTNAKTLHNIAVTYVSAEAQQRSLGHLIDSLSEEEKDIARRGKNAHKVTAPKNTSHLAYRSATALEAVFGYLYLRGKTQRIKELFEILVLFHDGEYDDIQLVLKKK